jgi:hypothetical protein
VVEVAAQHYAVRAITSDDAEAALAIARECGLTRWEWPQGAYGTVAEVDGEIVAFCAVREILTGLVIDELWCKQAAKGLRGLNLLYSWAEDLTAKLGVARGEDLYCGGIVTLDRTRHAAAMESRGYTRQAYVYGKQIPRAGDRIESECR